MSDQPEDPQAWHARIKDLSRRGDFLRAHDMARRACELFPQDHALRHAMLLSLARTGASERVIDQWTQFYGGTATDLEDLWRDRPALAIDLMAVRGRAFKDLAIGGRPADRPHYAVQAAEAYGAILVRALREGHRDLAGYPGINAATMWLLAGQPDTAQDLAAHLLAEAWPGDDDFYACATIAEAQLLLGRPDACATWLDQGMTFRPDLPSQATTRRQLRLICGLMGHDPTVLDRLGVPDVAMYAGKMFCRLDGPDGPAAEEARLRADVRDILERERIGAVFGSLACGADIVVAEVALELGADLTVVLPTPEARFLETSVSWAGTAWEDRFRACLDRAVEVIVTSRVEEDDDPVLFRRAGEIAMGLALGQADRLDSRAHMIALWDGVESSGPAGTAADMRRWRAYTGQDPHVLRLGTVIRPDSFRPAPPRSDPGTAAETRRIEAAVLFADLRAYSRYSEAQYSAFHMVVAPVLAEAVGAALADEAIYLNTWGDGIVAAAADADRIVACALAMLERLSEIDADSLGLPPLRMRIGAHSGLVTTIFDRMIGRSTIIGADVTLAARLEPITPPGEVYVTRDLAAILRLRHGARYGCEYVGLVPLAKQHGTVPIHHVTDLR
ncbi:adenylate/guanylate cyclase domain-containing protein [Rhodospira trueperi]|uniref:Adenylate cyclase, class 3 n=1 Tax=Rhodospira trueperi TaxID=69960 RepID=A0A1G7EKL5_9PROT|nr:adenylate/guanylate cyclase domain-containing protein [Rhodospira trueperi]SDE64188.1 Adenylate cyclase, class 3 [Rhodospira trueperi]